MIDGEGASSLGEEGVEASKFLDWARNYGKWWVIRWPRGASDELSLFYFTFERHFMFYFVSF